MDRERHPNVVRTWLAGKVQNQAVKGRNLKKTLPKSPPHNKT